MSESEPKEAATVVLLREVPTGLETFLMRRHRASGFMGGAFVFPGGKLDAADESNVLRERVPARERARCIERLEATPGRAWSPERAVGLAIATLRELFEEAGVLLARRAGQSELLRAEELSPWRGQILREELSFTELVLKEELELALDHLEYWDHWITPSLEPRRFDTRFFLARLPSGQNAEIDDKETTEARWLSPEAALSLHREQTLFLPPPTERTLEGLTDYAGFEALQRGAAERVVAAILPKLLLEDGAATIVMPWDSDYAAIPGEGLAVDAERLSAAKLGSRIPVGAGFLKRV